MDRDIPVNGNLDTISLFGFRDTLISRYGIPNHVVRVKHSPFEYKLFTERSKIRGFNRLWTTTNKWIN